ncbi:hypothetical protein ABZ897_02980 [Nonomuraea sp. NPDC046802]|uniref:hypothetical protein n=1 Tax=Nonomuraea sp. NPDC046802 TaxID=3154919 RepID=UPI0033CA5382
MNDLEARLRAAFDAQAQTFEASPHAWARIRDRRPRRAQSRWLLAALPVALLAVFVPVLLNGGLGRNSAADPDAIYQRLMTDRTAAGESVTVDNPSEGRPLRLWFARAKLGNPELCYVMERAAADPYGGCAPIDLNEDTAVWITGGSRREDVPTALNWGVSGQDVGAVTGVTKAGQKVPGTLVAPDGAPYKIWTVTYPAQDELRSVEYADPKGRGLGQWAYDNWTGEEPPAGAPLNLTDGVSVRPHTYKGGTALYWTRAGLVLGGGSMKAATEPVMAFVNDDVITGFARKDVARVEMSTRGGGTASAETRPDPWNLGVVLFSAATPAGDWRGGYQIVAYDALGKEVWRRNEPSRVPSDETPEKAVGEVMTIPGTEEFAGGPIRAWFSPVDNGMTMLCRSGDATPGRRRCVASQQGFFPQQATSYLPQPGAQIYLGIGWDDYESVEAVLADGQRVQAEFLRGKDTPARVWYVKLPFDADLLAFSYKVKGRSQAKIKRFDKGCERRATISEAPRVSLPANVSALLTDRGCVAFWEGGEIVPSLPGPLPGVKLSQLFGPERKLWWGNGNNAWYGYAPAGTAKVVATMKNGVAATAETTPDPWGQGVAFFAGPKPENADFSAGMTITGYDADGKELWRD